MAASDLPELCRFLDHAVLGPELTVAEAVAGIELGPKFNVRTVCVRPMDIALARTICRGSQTQVGTVLAFPHGTALARSRRTRPGDTWTSAPTRSTWWPTTR